MDGGGDTDEGTENEASVYLTPELKERHLVRERRRLLKQQRLVDRTSGSRSVSTDDEECYFSSAEGPFYW